MNASGTVHRPAPRHGNVFGPEPRCPDSDAHGRSDGVRVSVPSDPTARRPATAVLLFGIVAALVLGFGASGPAPFASPTAATLPAATHVAPTVNTTCPGPLETASYPGQLTVDGGPLSPSVVASVGITVSYFVQGVSFWLSNLTVTGYDCVEHSFPLTTNSTGRFGISIGDPPQSCVSVSPGGLLCTNYTAPFGPLNVTTTLPPPPGYGLSSVRNGSWYRLAYVADLTRLALSPPGPLLPLASNGPGRVVAIPEMANGSVSPVTPTYTWTLTGAGWSYVTPPTSGRATVVGDPGAAVGTLTVNATYTNGLGTFVAPLRSLELEAVTTSVSGGELNRTVVDAGGSVAVTVGAVGAAGYSYRANVTPGLGLASVSVPCTTTPASSAAVAVVCATSVTYPATGSGQISVDVSNGASSATWLSPDVTVDPPPALSMNPAGPVGYAGVPVAIAVEVAPGTGAAPFSDACLATADGAVDCSDAPGPTWTFDPTYSSPGNYSIRAWAIDAAGVNRSTGATVRIAAPLGVGPIAELGGNATANRAFGLSAALLGGVLPVRVFWNASDFAGPFAETVVGSDGTLDATFLPPSAGTFRIAVTAVDALGTVATASLWLAVDPGPAASVVSVGAAGPGSVVVGHPVTLAWQAFDAWDEPVRTFATPVALVLERSDGGLLPAWVNVSGLGALSSVPQGSFEVPASGWVGGLLNLTVTPASAGEFSVAIEGAGLPAAPAAVAVRAAPDLDHLRLFDPTVALAGDRTNRTFWRVSDRFGDPVPSTVLYVTVDSSTGSSESVVPVVTGANGTTGAWVNFSLAGASSGSLRVLDPAGDVLLGPLSLGPTTAAAATGLAIPVLAVGGAAALFGTATSTVVGRRARRRGRAAIAEAAAEEVELARLAEGRARVVEIVEAAGTVGLAEIAARWADGPTPPELADWIASLVADGSLRARPGPDGRAEFCLAPPHDGAPEPRVTVDLDAAARALARRDAAVREEDDDGPGLPTDDRSS